MMSVVPSCSGRRPVADAPPRSPSTPALSFDLATHDSLLYPPPARPPPHTPLLPARCPSLAAGVLLLAPPWPRHPAAATTPPHSPPCYGPPPPRSPSTAPPDLPLPDLQSPSPISVQPSHPLSHTTAHRHLSHGPLRTGPDVAVMAARQVPCLATPQLWLVGSQTRPPTTGCDRHDEAVAANTMGDFKKNFNQ